MISSVISSIYSDQDTLDAPDHILSGSLEEYFTPFRENVVGIQQCFDTPYGKNIPLIYTDWTASGRGYLPIEQRLLHDILPWMANTHTENSTTGTAMTYAYQEARTIIKQHVNASTDDILILSGSGTTSSINKLQRLLGLKNAAKQRTRSNYSPADHPVVFVTHMEHHSNHTSWLETLADVVVIRPTPEGLVDLTHLKELLHTYRSRSMKIAAVTACSNVTGVHTPYRAIARIMHQAQGYCFVDFAAAAPYVNIDMHPTSEDERLDAIYFSPHKFLGGPGSPGVLVFNKALYHNTVPDHPGGGTVDWTDPWGGRWYIKDIEEREDGGTPAILQTIRAAMSIQLKNDMNVEKIEQREQEQLALLWPRLKQIDNLHVLAPTQLDRLGIIAFYVEGLSYSAGVRMLNDRFGIQARGGCSCAGTYGHYLLGISRKESNCIRQAVDHGVYINKPGWIRLSLHPTLTDREIHFVADSLEALAENHDYWIQDYKINPRTGVVRHRNMDADTTIKRRISACFTQAFH
ncbi:MAG: aminotransferase class V-fold PLP-dependent enzyme [Cyclobacteriaceae bacterium]